MPQIKEYKVQSTVSGVPDVQMASPAQSGAEGAGKQQLANAGLELAQIINKRQEQAEVSDVHANLSKTQAVWTQKYQQELQQGTLDTETFSQEFSDAMDAQAETVSTRAGKNYFNQASAALKAHFTMAAAEGQAELAGAKARSNYVESLNAGSSTLLNDPSSFELVNSLQEKSIDNLVATGGLPAAKADELKAQSRNDLAKSSIRGWIKLDPEATVQELNSGRWDSVLGDHKTPGGDVKNQMIGEAEQAVRGKSVEQERMKRQQKEAAEAAQTATQNEFLAKMSVDQLSTKDILESGLEPFGSGSKEQFIKLLQQHEEQKAQKIKTDPGTFMTLWDDIHLPDGDPKKIVDENDLNKYMGRGLTVQDINILRGEIQGKKTLAGEDEAALKKNMTEMARAKLVKTNPMTGIPDPSGMELYQKFTVNFLSDYNEQRKKGKTPRELLDPASPDYLGKGINSYLRPINVIIKDQMKMISKNPNAPTPPPVEPRGPNETMSQYLKRTGK